MPTRFTYSTPRHQRQLTHSSVGCRLCRLRRQSLQPTQNSCELPEAVRSQGKKPSSLLHLPLTFSGVVCILSLQGRQEQCPFTTRLRVLKLCYSAISTRSTHE